MQVNLIQLLGRFCFKVLVIEICPQLNKMLAHFCYVLQCSMGHYTAGHNCYTIVHGSYNLFTLDFERVEYLFNIFWHV